jgi:hypothetical protein
MGTVTLLPLNSAVRISYLRQGDKGSGIRVSVARIGVEAANLFQRDRFLRFFNDFLKARIVAQRIPPRM